MLSVLDTVITSNDMSIDRVLQAGLPVVMLFTDRDLPADFRRSLDELAGKHAGKALIVLLRREDAPQTVSRFNVRQFPILVAYKDGQESSRQGNATPADVQAYVTYLLGQGPKPAPQAAEPRPASTQQSRTSQARSAGPVNVDEADFEQEVLRSERPVLVDFWAVWCGPCRFMEPVIEKLAHQNAATLKVAKVNVDENPNISGRYGISGIPTMIVFQNGREVDRLVGALPESALRGRLARWIEAS